MRALEILAFLVVPLGAHERALPAFPPSAFESQSSVLKVRIGHHSWVEVKLEFPREKLAGRDLTWVVHRELEFLASFSAAWEAPRFHLSQPFLTM